MPAPWKSLRALVRRDRLFYAHVGVTHRCNMRCRMCTVPERGNVGREVSPDRFRVLARELADLGCAMISIGGGEPLLHGDLPGVVAAFVENGMRVRVLTNGIAGAKNIVAELTRAGASDISISLDSLDPTAQAALEDLPGLLPKKMETIAAVTRELPRGVHILNAVVTRPTLPGLLQVAEFAERIGFYSSFIPIHLADPQTPHHFFTAAGELALDAPVDGLLRDTYVELLKRRVGGGVINSRAYLLNSLRYLTGKPVDWECSAGRLYVSVDPSARVSICHQFEETHAVEPDGFAKLYREGNWRAEADRMASPCHDCYRPCWAEIDHLADEAEAFIGALRIRARSLLRPVRRRSPEELTAVAEGILGGSIRPAVVPGAA